MGKIFAVGDVQGCFGQLQRLIQKIGRENIDQLWLAGDLVNRGPQSLETLQWCVANQHWVKVVLGNHDLHLLAIAAGIRGVKLDDTIEKILTAPNSDLLLDWLRHQPLVHYAKGHLMVHAGLLPQWTVAHALELNDEVCRQLKSADWKTFLSTMYGNTPCDWTPSLRGADRSRVIINAMTRLRFCTVEGTIDFTAKEGLDSAPAGFLPWFKVPNRQTGTTPIVFGHWSTLGLTNKPDLLSIDTGCVWGNLLTAAEITSVGTRQIVQVSGYQAARHE
jgi:bis(5'-nucleosyl)-tetraphosphatase (symmetrical)